MLLTGSTALRYSNPFRNASATSEGGGMRIVANFGPKMVANLPWQRPLNDGESRPVRSAPPIELPVLIGPVQREIKLV